MKVLGLGLLEFVRLDVGGEDVGVGMGFLC